MMAAQRNILGSKSARKQRDACISNRGRARHAHRFRGPVTPAGHHILTSNGKQLIGSRPLVPNNKRVYHLVIPWASHPPSPLSFTTSTCWRMGRGLTVLSHLLNHLRPLLPEPWDVTARLSPYGTHFPWGLTHSPTSVPSAPQHSGETNQVGVTYRNLGSQSLLG